ncbi:probable lysophospholipase BODYGUARD 4 [Mercurialis annua]|uniref:probable lysophospholipase BODYGUARD 4 n=1 Tax=Mercurialis annua TaxID=3986 RepID=UPI0024AD838D|nr:probable lysophospholipase BODYGUARD 4 [Mercurialis annua]
MLNSEIFIPSSPSLVLSSFSVSLIKFLAMTVSQTMSVEKLARKFQSYLHNALAFIVFLFLDFVDAVLCVVYKCLDMFLEGKSSPCHCRNKDSSIIDEEDDGQSDSFYGRNNAFRKLVSFVFQRKWKNISKKAENFGNGEVKNKWSDCNCESCLSWLKDGGERLHVVVKEPSPVRNDKIGEDENVIFVHGFLCSSSFWTESVFKNLSETANRTYRLFAIDLLGLGKSPKPLDCQYTLKDHLEMIEKSVINPYNLKSFHLVAHSMGCPIALALAAKYPKSVKSLTLVAPAIFSCGKDEGGVEVLNKLAEKKLWPVESFQRSVMSWYEHIGRSVCFFVCRHHRTWESLLMLLTNNRKLSFAVKDLTKHTHHSSWHNVHNVICGGAKFMDGYLEILKNAGVKFNIVHGDRDNTIPTECSYDIKRKVGNAELSIIRNGTHSSVIFRRKKDFTQNLEHFWASTLSENSSL